MTQEAQIECLSRCCRSLLPGGMLVFDTFFPALELIGAPENTRVLEGEREDEATGQTMQLYDTRSFDRVAQVQRSINEVEYLDKQGNVVRVDRSAHEVRWVYKAEMELLLRVAGFARWEISGGFDLRPLTLETDPMVVRAWAGGEA